MRFFTLLRAALEQAARVEKIEHDVQSLQFEWTDTLDKLLAREERWRKRYKSEVNRALETPSVAVDSADGKAGLRASLQARRLGAG